MHTIPMTKKTFNQHFLQNKSKQRVHDFLLLEQDQTVNYNLN